MDETIKAPTKAPTEDPFRLAEFFAQGQNWFANWSQVSDRWMQGMLNIAREQAELSRTLIEGGLAGFNIYGSSRRPEDLLEAQLGQMRQRMDQIIKGMRKMADEVYACCFETAALSLPGKEASKSASETGGKTASSFARPAARAAQTGKETAAAE
ncbi:MAG: phasin family protein [Acidobacteriia bacterium]|nr:phasin family protein [Methyloceanibacter sp.]MBX5471953.1 phasin family protein [Acetobacteraceae bacterium]MCL6490496.1 phasin family protein [Terriglobia bacterium]